MSLPKFYCRACELTLCVLIFSSVVTYGLGIDLDALASKNVVDAATASPTGIIVPLYSYPGDTWDELVRIKNNSPGVPIIAIVNPSNGVGSVKNPDYVSGINEFKSAGIIVLGYVWTDYAKRDISQVKSEISKYKNWYAVDGVFFDAMSNGQRKAYYYKNLSNYANSKGLEYTIGNPGTDTREKYIGTVDSIVIHENAGIPSLSYLDGWHSTYEKKNFSFVSYDVESLDESYIVTATQYVGYLYVTDDALPNPYDSLPGYFEQLVSIVSEANGSS
ncbi:MAG: spherulation-specific family 4 protein [Nitrososphaera sp.]|nr:spherulation-specific family 4 protein [Nitrososphaera sp.]